MARTRKKRRTEEEVRTLALDMAKEGPFAPADLAEKAGFSGNRARQILEGLGEKKKLVILGLRKSPRGKPANLWGFAGTKVSEADKQPRPRNKTGAAKKVARPARSAGVAPGPRSAKVVSAVDPGLVLSLRRVFDRIFVHGFEVQGPAGLTFHVRLGGAERPQVAKGRKTRKARKARGRPAKASGAESPKASAPEKKAPARPARKPGGNRKLPVAAAAPEAATPPAPN